jgi:hypothetical protein
MEIFSLLAFIFALLAFIKSTTISKDMKKEFKDLKQVIQEHDSQIPI